MGFVEDFARDVAALGGHAYVIGGWVRDKIMGISSKDIDIEVFGLTQPVLENLLSKYGEVNLVGKHFGVYKVGDIDVSIPRTERKSGIGHKGFDVIPDPYLTLNQAVLRRDLTINAIFYDPLTQQFIDPVGGIQDINNKILRCVSPNTFVEDPLRVYRVMQFVSRFNFAVEPKLIRLCAQMVEGGELDSLPKERVFEEFGKLLSRGINPSYGLSFIQAIGIVQRYFPELQAMIGVQQEREWHAEGDCWNHTLMVLDEGVKHRNSLEYPTAFMFACLCHDLGKPSTTEIIDNRITSRGHEEAGEPLAREFMNKLTNNIQLIEQVAFIVRHHLLVNNWYLNRPIRKSTAIKLYRELDKLGLNHSYLVAISKSDNMGRVCLTGKITENYDKIEWFDGLMSSLVVGPEAAPRMVDPLVTGHDLIALGLKPGPRFKEVLESAYSFQVDNDIKDKALVMEFVRKMGYEKNPYSWERKMDKERASYVCGFCKHYRSCVAKQIYCPAYGLAYTYASHDELLEDVRERKKEGWQIQDFCKICNYKCKVTDEDARKYGIDLNKYIDNSYGKYCYAMWLVAQIPCPVPEQNPTPICPFCKSAAHVTTTFMAGIYDCIACNRQFKVDLFAPRFEYNPERPEGVCKLCKYEITSWRKAPIGGQETPACTGKVYLCRYPSGTGLVMDKCSNFAMGSKEEQLGKQQRTQTLVVCPTCKGSKVIRYAFEKGHDSAKMCPRCWSGWVVEYLIPKKKHEVKDIPSPFNIEIVPKYEQNDEVLSELPKPMRIGLKEKYGITPRRRIGMGAYGEAFSIPKPKRVRKLTSDEEEAYMVATAIRSGFKHPNLIKYYSIYKIPYKEGSDMVQDYWLIDMEEAEGRHLTKAERDIFRNAVSYDRDIKHGWRLPKDYRYKNEIAKAMFLSFYNQIKDLADAIKEEFGIRLGDLDIHSGNVKIKDGQLKFFDILRKESRIPIRYRRLKFEY